jgi:nitrogen regulation protein NR(I)
MASVLVVDDDGAILHLVKHALGEMDVRVVTSGTGGEAIVAVKRGGIDVVLLDVLLPDETGLDVFQEIQRIDAQLPVIFITMMGSSETTIEAMKLGAFDYLQKPLDLKKLQEMVTQGLEIRRLMSVPVALDREGPARENAELMIGNSPRMLDVYKTIGRISPQDIPVLIFGESGTGKELVARAIFQHGKRSKGPFLALNCAAIPEALLESELFGHEKGSFTGATSQRLGKFEQCRGGTIFLDEIGDMPLLLQAKILRVLQEQRFERVGGNETIKTDVRVVAATHRDLESLVARNLFRADLLFRLKGVSIHLPPLRDRKEDIPVLAEHFLARYAREMGREVQGISPEAMALIRRYGWPGNIRELQSVMRLAVLQATGPVLIPEFLPIELHEFPAATLAGAVGEEPHDAGLESFFAHRLGEGTEDLYAEALERMERQLITSVLRHTHGNQSHASKILGITRGSLRNKIRALGIMIEQDVRIENDALAD